MTVKFYSGMASITVKAGTSIVFLTKALSRTLHARFYGEDVYGQQGDGLIEVPVTDIAEINPS